MSTDRQAGPAEGGRGTARFTATDREVARFTATDREVARFTATDREVARFTAAQFEAARRDAVGRDEVLDTLLGPGSQVRAGEIEQPGCRLVGGIGLPWLRDLDFGTNWLARAAELDWPADVLLEDLSYSAHRVMHRLQELEPAKVILLGCMPRGTDPAGTIRRYRLRDIPVMDDEEVHDRLAESVGGIIDLDHTIAVCRHWNALPEDALVIEVEPAERDFGWGFSEPVEQAVARVLDLVRAEVAP